MRRSKRGWIRHLRMNNGPLKSAPDLFSIRQRADADGLLELPGKRGLIGVAAGQGDLGDRLGGG